MFCFTAQASWATKDIEVNKNVARIKQSLQEIPKKKDVKELCHPPFTSF